MLHVFAMLIKVSRASRIPRLRDARDAAIAHGTPSLASSRPGSLPLNGLVSTWTLLGKLTAVVTDGGAARVGRVIWTDAHRAYIQYDGADSFCRTHGTDSFCRTTAPTANAT